MLWSLELVVLVFVLPWDVLKLALRLLVSQNCSQLVLTPSLLKVELMPPWEI
jgi:hypothetical protein